MVATPFSDPVSILIHLLGQQIVAIEQAFYVFNNAIDRSNSLLQLRLDSGFTIHFWVGADGETVRIVAAPWDDPFTELLNDENRAFIEHSGKWALFDTSATPEMAPLIEQPVRSVGLIHDQLGAVRGVQLEIGSALLTNLVAGDEGFVIHGPAADDEFGPFDVVPVAPHLG